MGAPMLGLYSATVLVWSTLGQKIKSVLISVVLMYHYIQCTLLMMCKSKTLYITTILSQGAKNVLID